MLELLFYIQIISVNQFNSIKIKCFSTKKYCCPSDNPSPGDAGTYTFKYYLLVQKK